MECNGFAKSKKSLILIMMRNHHRFRLSIISLSASLSLAFAVITPSGFHQGKVGSPIPVAPHPTALAWDGQYLWVISQQGKNVQQIDPESGQVVYSFTGGKYPQDILYADNAIWLAYRQEHMIQQLDLLTMQKHAFPASRSPRALAYDPVSKSLWVACHDYQLVRHYDASSGKRLPGIVDGLLEAPRLLAWGEEGLWLAGKKTVQYFEADSDTLQQYDLPGYIYHILWDGQQLWLSTALPYALVRLKPDGERDSYAVGSRPYALAWDGRYLWVSDYVEGSLHQIDPQDGSLRQTIYLGYRPHALLWVNDRLWVADILGHQVQWVKP